MPIPVNNNNNNNNKNKKNSDIGHGNILVDHDQNFSFLLFKW